MFRATIAVLGLVAGLTATATSNPQLSTVTFSVHRCGDQRVPLRLRIGLFGSYLPNPSDWTYDAAAGNDHYRVALAPGLYVVDSAQRNCVVHKPFQVLAGFNRSLNLRSTPIGGNRISLIGFWDHGHVWMAGRLPADVASAALYSVVNRYQVIPVVVSSGAYYVENVVPYRYAIRITMRDGKSGTLPMDLEKQRWAHSSIHDVSKQDVDAAVKDQRPAFELPTKLTSADDGSVWFVNPSGGTVGYISVKGDLHQFDLGFNSQPTAMAQGADGAMWVVARGLKAFVRIDKNGATRVIKLERPIYGQLPVSVARFEDRVCTPLGTSVACVDAIGNVRYADIPVKSEYSGSWFALADTKRDTLWLSGWGLWKMDSAFVVTRLDDSEIWATALSGNGTVWAASGDQILSFESGEKRAFSMPLEHSEISDIAVDMAGIVWAVDDAAHTLIRIGPDGKVHQYAIDKEYGLPNHLAIGADGQIWYSALHAALVNKGGPFDGETAYHLSKDASPTYLAVSSTGEIWVSETNLGRIYRLGPGIDIEYDLLSGHHRTVTSRDY